MRFDRALRGTFGGAVSAGRMAVAAPQRTIRRSISYVAACVATLLFLVACSSGGGSATSSDPATGSTGGEQTTSSIAVTSSPSTFSPTTVTATTSATDPVTTEVPTEAPTTTIDPRAKAEADVRAAIAATIAAFDACVRALPHCDPATLESTRRGDLLRINTERITEWNAAGYEIRDRDTFRYVIETVDVNGELTEATAVVCIADGTKLVKPGAGPGGADVIINGDYVSGRETWDVRLDSDGVWRPYAAPASGPAATSDICPAG